ncbi:two-component histidine kinase [Weissella oryzae SG25]|uniref:Two-component histidine kinase n=1 Tax=Weissella oryzae (strain DSM 25784 / JCM 18191 / LMG 30913 / SG25) TaxID=1329250 RepID=A0A069CX38_WEIOS|nr:hypothetical protein [Weissella oryzae]GAK31942.1 two-component histidine kinase [Weissella oryzae SG25]
MANTHTDYLENVIDRFEKKLDDQATMVNNDYVRKDLFNKLDSQVENISSKLDTEIDTRSKWDNKLLVLLLTLLIGVITTLIGVFLK